jgi:Putative peptidoglycan binding domain
LGGALGKAGPFKADRVADVKEAEDRISAGPTAATSERSPIRGVLRRRRTVLAAALIVAVCLLGALAAAGVFSSSHPVRSLATTATAGGAPTTTPTPSVTQTQPVLATPPGPLKPGDQGVAVKRLQRALAHLGYPPGTVDGQYGPSTTQAVSRFQRAHGLTADGILGPNTLRALARAIETG